MGFFKSVGKFLGKVVDTVVKGVTNVVEAVVDFVGDVVDFVVSPFGSLFDVPDPNIGEQSAQYAQGVTVTKSGTTLPLPIIYGYRRVGGNIVYVDTQGDSNKYLYVCYALSHGEVTGLKRLFIDDNELPRSLFSNSDKFPNESVVTVNAGRYSGRLKLQFFRGSATQTQSTLLNESTQWGKKKRTLPGVCYLAARYEWRKIETQEDQENNPYSGGVPQIKADILGTKVYDIGANHNGNASITNYSSATKTLSYNPIDCLLDYLTNTTYGAGLPITEIDGESFYIAHNKLDQTVTYFTGATGKVMTMNAVLNTGNKIIDNVRQLLTGSRSLMPFVQGVYKVRVEDAGNDTDIVSSVTNVKFDLEENFIVNEITLLGERKNNYFNQVTVNYVDPDREFTNQQEVFPAKGSADETAFLAADNDEVLTGEFSFPTLTNQYIARHMAKMILEKSRQQRVLNFRASPDLIAVEPGDVIRVNHTRLGLTNVLFRVVGLQITQDSSCIVECVEVIATLYPFIDTDEADLPSPPNRPDPILPNPTPPTPVVPPIGISPPEDPQPPNLTPDSAGEPVPDPNPPSDPVIPPPPDEPEQPPVTVPTDPVVPPDLPEDPDDPQQPPVEPPPPPPPPLPPGVREFKGIGRTDLGFPAQCHKTSVFAPHAAMGTGDANGISGIRLIKYPYSVYANGRPYTGYYFIGLYLNVPADSTISKMRIFKQQRGTNPNKKIFIGSFDISPNRFSAQAWDIDSFGFWAYLNNPDRLIQSADEYWSFDFIRELNGSQTILPDRSPQSETFADVGAVEFQKSNSNTQRQFINTNGNQVVRYLDQQNNVRFGTSFEAWWNHIIQTQFPGSTGFAGFNANVDLGG